MRRGPDLNRPTAGNLRGFFSRNNPRGIPPGVTSSYFYFGFSLDAAFGCVEPEKQPGAVFARKRPDVLTVTCNASGFEYQLHCTGNDWVGQQYNCSDIGKRLLLSLKAFLLCLFKQP